MPQTECTLTPKSAANATDPAQWQCRNCLCQNTNRFCSQCGQAHAQVLQILPLLRQASAQVLDIDSPWRRTLSDLIRHPAKMMLDYFAGARKRYVNPVFFILIVGTVHWFVLHTFVSDLARTLVAEEAAQKYVERILSAMGYLAVIAALPAAWLIAKIGKQFSAAEYYVAMVYNYGLVLLIMPVFYLVKFHHWPWFSALNFLMICVWFVFVFSQFHIRKWHGGVIGLLSYIFLYLFVIIFSAMLVLGERFIESIMK